MGRSPLRAAVPPRYSSPSPITANGSDGGREGGGVLRRAQPQGRGSSLLQAGPRLCHLRSPAYLLPFEALHFLLLVPLRLRPRRRYPSPTKPPPPEAPSRPRRRSRSPSPSRPRPRSRSPSRSRWHRSRSRSRSRERRRRSRERERADRRASRRRSRSRSRSPSRRSDRSSHAEYRRDQHGDRRRNDDGGGRESSKGRGGRDGGKVDYSRLIEGYDRMTPAERVKAKMKLKLSETASKDSTLGTATVGWERFEFNKDAPLDEDDNDVEVANDDVSLVKHIGKSFRFSAVESKHEDVVRDAHDEAIFGVPASSIVDTRRSEDELKTNDEDKKAEDVEAGPSSSLVSDNVLALQKGSWRERALKLRQNSTT